MLECNSFSSTGNFSVQMVPPECLVHLAAKDQDKVQIFVIFDKESEKMSNKK